MTSRSIMLGTALLLTTAVPVPGVLAPAVAVAQDASPVAAIVTDPTPAASLDLKVLRQRAQALRAAIQSGALKGPDRKAAAAKLALYRAEIQQRQQAAKAAQQPKQAAQAEADQPQQQAQQQVQAQTQTQQAQTETQPAQKKAAALSPEVTAALGDTRAASELETPALRQRIQTLRQALQSMGPAEKKMAATKIKADRDEFIKRQQAAKKQQQPAAQATETTQQGQQQTAETQENAQTQVGGDAVAALADDRPSASLELPELRKRFLSVRAAIKSGSLSGPQLKKAQQMFAADRQELVKRKNAGNVAATQPQTQTATQTQQTTTQAAQELPPAEVEGKAKKLLAEKTEASTLDDKALRKRLAETRTVLASKNLSPQEQRQLRQRLANDRKILRDRVASRQDQTANASNQTTQGDQVVTNTVTNNSGVVNNNTTINNTVNNVNVIVQQQTPPDRLNQRQLDQRIRTLRVAVREQRLDRQQMEIAEHILVEDQRFLRQRLIRDRDARRERWRHMRDRNELHIDFNVAIVAPPIITAAEADYGEIETQLVAPPRRLPPQRYSLEQIVEDDNVRQAMPGIDIDTLNFDSGSAEIRPEEVEKLESVAQAIEKIVTVRPDEVFMIEGHTDAVGSDEANQQLSLARANSVKQALVEFYAINDGNLRAAGLGERFLKIPTDEAEEENRRVTVRRITPLLTGEAG